MEVTIENLYSPITREILHSVKFINISLEDNHHPVKILVYVGSRRSNDPFSGLSLRFLHEASIVIQSLQEDRFSIHKNRYTSDYPSCVGIEDLIKYLTYTVANHITQNPYYIHEIIGNIVSVISVVNGQPIIISQQKRDIEFINKHKKIKKFILDKEDCVFCRLTCSTCRGNGHIDDIFCERCNGNGWLELKIRKPKLFELLNNFS